VKFFTHAGIKQRLFLHNTLRIQGLRLIILSEESFVNTLCFPDLLLSLCIYRGTIIGASV